METISGWYVAPEGWIAIKINFVEKGEGVDFYWTDEPLGYSITADQLKDRKNAALALIEFYENYGDPRREFNNEDIFFKWRKGRIDFINSTRKYGSLKIEDYKDKKRIEEWFTFADAVKVLEEENNEKNI